MSKQKSELARLEEAVREASRVLDEERRKRWARDEQIRIELLNAAKAYRASGNK